ncbi:MAG: hypothetical protein ABIK68_03080 [bacterium]
MEPKKKRNTCLIVGLAVVVLCLCGAVAAGGIGYYLYSSGKLTPDDIAKIFGMGPAEIQIANLSDSTLTAELTYIDDETGEERSSESLEMGPYDLRTISGLSARTYTLTFASNSGSPEGGSCHLKVRGGDSLSFIAVPEGIGVIKNGESVSSSEEVNIQTSPICRGE